MGTPAFTNSYVSFDTEEHAASAELAFRNWVKLAHEKKLPEREGEESLNGDYGIGNINRDGTEITYEVASERYQNCIWQCENIRDFWKTQPGLECVEQPVMTCEDSIDWYKEDEVPSDDEAE